MARRRATADFESLVREHHGEVWRSARRVLRSADDAQDVTQEVFLRVLDGRLQLDDESEPRRVLCWWSIRIALNTQRGARRRRAHEDQHAMERVTSSEQSGDGRQLWGFVEELPGDLRVPVVLRFAEGFGYAAIGEAIGVAESTAHERVQRGLAKLRGLLKGAGLGALALNLESSIGSAAPAQAPAGLAKTLLEMKGAAVGATASGGLLAVAGVGVLAIGGVAYAVFGGGAGEGGAGLDPSERVVAVADRVGDGDEREVPGGGAAAQPDVAGRTAIGADPATETGDDDVAPDTGTVMGRIVAPGVGPVADCDVSVFSVERSGKLHAYGTQTTTDASGRFRATVEVAPSDEDGGYYRVQVVRKGYAVLRSEPKLVRAGAETDFGTLEAAAGAGLLDGSYSLDIDVVDTDGRAVVGAVIQIASTVDLPVPTGTTWAKWLNVGDRLERKETRVTTDGSGLARVDGDTLGGKSALVLPPGEGLAPKLVRFVVTAGETVALTVVLEPGLDIAGHVSLHGETFMAEMADGIKLHIVDSLAGQWLFADVQSDGAFRFADLPSGTHRVHASNNDWRGVSLRLSSGWLDVVAGTENVELELKRSDDPRDVGVHGAELHGRFLRAEDQEPLRVGFWSLDVDAIHAGDSFFDPGTDVQRDWLPNNLFPRPVQRAATGAIPEASDVFHRTGMAAGTYFVRVSMRGRAMFTHGPLTVGGRDVVNDLVLEVHAGATLSGTVLGPEGDAVEDAFVFLTGVGPISDATIVGADRAYREAGGRGFYFVNGTGGRSKGGRFEIDALPPDVAFRLVAVHPKYAPVIGATVTLKAGEARSDAALTFSGPR